MVMLFPAFAVMALCGVRLGYCWMSGEPWPVRFLSSASEFRTDVPVHLMVTWTAAAAIIGLGAAFYLLLIRPQYVVSSVDEVVADVVLGAATVTGCLWLSGGLL